jgi:DnaJ like chaperone protein
VRAGRIAAAFATHAWAIAGACIGAFAGWFELIAGLVIGNMLDIARLEARARKRISDFLARPEGREPPEPIMGYAAAVCIALRGDWPGLDDRDTRRILFDRFSDAVIPPKARERREADRVADVAAHCVHPDLPTLARRLAFAEAPLARGLLADWAFALAALGGTRLDPGDELTLRASLVDCGVSAREMIAARLKAFPGERDPWTVLGLSPGAPRADIKRAYRRISRLVHPDALPGDDGERFRELRAAYAELMSRPR